MMAAEITPMSRWKRLFYYLTINIFFSVCATLVVLQLLGHNQTPEAPAAPAMIGKSGVIAPPTLTAIAELNLGETIIITAVVTVIQTPPTPYPTRGIVTYRVKPGDTLIGIASLFGISLESLMDINNLRDPNLVVEGVDLLIPAPPTPTATFTPTPEGTLPPTATPTLTPTPRETATPTPSGPPPPAQAVIDSVIGAGDLGTERIVIKIIGSGELSLFDWQITDQDGYVFTFPQLTLSAGAQVNVYTQAGQSSVSSLYWNLAQPVWRRGETVTLIDAQGQARAAYTVP
jgi:LysM repeat protein